MRRNLLQNAEGRSLKEHRRRRKSGASPYPLQYSSALRNLDVWDHMFLVQCCKGITMHPFAQPPAKVLDLGCGSGYWAIEAAKRWTDSTIVGFDLHKYQPRLSILGLPNLRWVHGNMLEKLPFGSSCFDFVRIVGVGLGVPEDEWQCVLEEVERVMKPGAVLEVIEEDLIFPCGPTPDTASEVVQCYSPTSPFGVLSDGWSSRLHVERPSGDTPPKSPASTLSCLRPWPTRPDVTKTFNPTQTTQTSDSWPYRDYHRQDHTKLQQAWDAMLSGRFLTKQLTAVLSFYLASTFIDVHTHVPLNVPLPPNSRSTATFSDFNDSFEPDILFRMKSYSRKLSIDISSDCTSLRSEDNSSRRIPLYSSMHLAKTMQTVIACKESIWVEYERLFRPMGGPVQRGLSVNKKTTETYPESLREEFERAWSNWECDMMDRMGMRRKLSAECSWHETSGEQPNWCAWRNDLDIGPSAPPSRPSSAAPQELCRSLRCFICWKPS